MTDDPRLHDAVSAENVRRLLDGRLTDPMPGTLAAEVLGWGLLKSAQGFQAGRQAGREEVLAEVRAEMEKAIAEAADILKGFRS